jgi:hypothetical protein
LKYLLKPGSIVRVAVLRDPDFTGSGIIPDFLKQFSMKSPPLIYEPAEEGAFSGRSLGHLTISHQFHERFADCVASHFLHPSMFFLDNQ